MGANDLAGPLLLLLPLRDLGQLLFFFVQQALQNPPLGVVLLVGQLSAKVFDIQPSDSFVHGALRTDVAVVHFTLMPDGGQIRRAREGYGDASYISY